jgi:hypothetical protein
VTRVLVCGSRDWTDQGPIYAVLDGYDHDPLEFGVTVINGGAPGADSIAKRWAELNKVPCITCMADWKGQGKAAGPIRNGKMLGLHPDVVWAFVTKPLDESRGTADMVRRARAVGTPTYVVSRP